MPLASSAIRASALSLEKGRSGQILRTASLTNSFAIGPTLLARVFVQTVSSAELAASATATSEPDAAVELLPKPDQLSPLLAPSATGALACANPVLAWADRAELAELTGAAAAAARGSGRPLL